MTFQALTCTSLSYLVFAVAAVEWSSLLSAQGWPDYRGPAGDGHASNRSHGVPLHWSDEEHVAWKTDLPELGLSSPVVLDGRVWLTTATEDGHDFFVLGIDAQSGELFLNQRLFHSDQPESSAMVARTIAMQPLQ